ncbi:MAG: chemotaxis protein CheW [Pirellulales bacterium]
MKQIFPNVPTSPIPGAYKLLLGVANLNGLLRSIVDLRVLVNLPTTPPDAGYIILLHASGKSLGVWVETLEGVSHIDLDRLTDVDGTASDSAGKLTKGTTDDRILALDATVLVEHVAEQLHQHVNNQ